MKSSINFIIKVRYNLLSVEITHYIKQDMKILGRYVNNPMYTDTHRGDML